MRQDISLKLWQRSRDIAQDCHPLYSLPWEPITWCKISGFHSGDYEECRLLRCGAMWLLLESTFRRNISPPSSGWKEITANVFLSSLILSTLMMVVLHSSETSLLIRATRHHIPVGGFLYSQVWAGNLDIRLCRKSYNLMLVSGRLLGAVCRRCAWQRCAGLPLWHLAVRALPTDPCIKPTWEVWLQY
jgi:hypothetical protein